VTRLPGALESWQFAARRQSASRIHHTLWDPAVVSASVQVGLALSIGKTLLSTASRSSGVSANMAVVPLLTLAVPVGFLAVFSGSQTVADLSWLVAQDVAEGGRLARFVGAGWRIPDPPLCLPWRSPPACFCRDAARGRARRRWTAGAASLLSRYLLWSPFPPQVIRGELRDDGHRRRSGGMPISSLFRRAKLMVLDAAVLPITEGRKSKIDTGRCGLAVSLDAAIKRLDVVAVRTS